MFIYKFGANQLINKRSTQIDKKGNKTNSNN
jgi:hypothetical protein